VVKIRVQKSNQRKQGTSQKNIVIKEKTGDWGRRNSGSCKIIRKRYIYIYNKNGRKTVLLLRDVMTSIESEEISKEKRAVRKINTASLV
jgi:hypothetical protein